MSYEVEIFGLQLTINPVAFTLPIGKNGWDVYWYGIIIALGFLLAVVYALIYNEKRFGINTDKMLDVVLVTVPVAILCARAYYVIFDGVKLGGIKDFFGFGDSSGFAGIAIYGGVIGAFLCGALMCYIRKVNILDMFDLASVGFIIGQGVGRWGNFINQEAYGTFTGSDWWGMSSNRTIMEMGEGLVHPCFLYESVWCVIGFFVLNAIAKKRRFKGQVFLSYIVWYSFARFFIEMLRTDSLMIGKIRVSCLVSALIFIGATIILVILFNKNKQQVNEGEYETVFAANADEAEAPKEETAENE
jgi:phosphatidylglycerol:prolipoprotein diacylglycerol transferase